MLRDAWAVGLRIGICPDDRYSNCRPFFHVAGSTLSALMALVAGATVLTRPTFEAVPAPATGERAGSTLGSAHAARLPMPRRHAGVAEGKVSDGGGLAMPGPR